MSRKPFMREISPTRWYFQHPRYLRYMSREVTCIFIGAFALLMLFTLERLSRGPAVYEAFLTMITGAWSVFGLLIVLVFAVHNTTSWFNVTPKAMPVQLGEEFLAGKYIVGAHYAAWAVASGLVLFFAGVL